MPETRQPEGGDPSPTHRRRRSGQPERLAFFWSDPASSGYGSKVDLSSLAALVPLRQSTMDRVAHARDLWPRNTLRLSQGQLPPLPLAIAQPQSLQQIQDCLKWATEHRIAMVPYGAGSGV